MDASLAVSCIDMPRGGYLTWIPYHLYIHLSAARQKEIRDNYNKRQRGRDHVAAFRLDPQFRISFPSEPLLTYESLMPTTTLNTVNMDANYILRENGPLLPSINDTLYVHPPTKNRTFDSLLNTYDVSEDGTPPKFLSPKEYLALLKKSNKALDAAISAVNSKIIKKSLEVQRYVKIATTPSIQGRPPAAAAAAAAAAAEGAGAASAASAPTALREAVLAQTTAISNVVGALYNNRILRDNHGFNFDSYRALGISSSLIDTIREVAREKLRNGQNPTVLELFIFCMGKLNKEQMDNLIERIRQPR